MNKELMMQILLKDGNTKSEAEKRLADTPFPAIIYDDFSEYIEGLKECGVYAGETVEDAKQGKCSCRYVEHEGKDYFIEYFN